MADELNQQILTPVDIEYEMDARGCRRDLVI